MEHRDTIRLQLTLHYDGSGFHGWQLQPDQRTVQGELEAALTRLADRPRAVLAAGRTDAGVHALGQVASVDMPSSWTPRELRRALNAILPGDIWVARARRAGDAFHPRYDAIARTYEYRLGTAADAASPFHARWCWPVTEPLDEARLRRGAEQLPGTRSFRAFAKSGQPERGYTCTVSTAEWDAWERGLSFRIRADRFLHHMVRYLVGTLVDVGRGAREETEMARLLDEDPVLETSPPAPPQGLFLVEVEYPEGEPSDSSIEPIELGSHTPA